MRDRLIRAEFFTDKKIGLLSLGARLLFIGLWGIADRDGRLVEDAEEFRVKVFPYDHKINIGGLLEELIQQRLIVRYDAESCAAIFIPKFRKHQRPHKREKSSILPEPLQGLPKKEQGHSMVSVSVSVSSSNLRNKEEDKAEAKRLSQEGGGGGKPASEKPDRLPVLFEDGSESYVRLSEMERRKFEAWALNEMRLTAKELRRCYEVLHAQCEKDFKYRGRDHYQVLRRNQWPIRAVEKERVRHAGNGFKSERERARDLFDEALKTEMEMKYGPSGDSDAVEVDFLNLGKVRPPS